MNRKLCLDTQGNFIKMNENVCLDEQGRCIKISILHLSRQTQYIYQDKMGKKWDKIKKKRHEFGIKLPQKRDKIAHYRRIEEIPLSQG